jgi:hypothetical protein
MDRQSLNWHEAREFARYGIIAPPHMILLEGFDINVGGVPITPVPRKRAPTYEISRRGLALPLRKRAKARYSPDNEYWPSLFAKERKGTLGMCNMHRQEIPPQLRNAEERRSFWSVPGRGILKEHFPP